MNLKFCGNIIGIVAFQIVFYVHLVLTGLCHERFLIPHTGTFGCTVREGNANIQNNGHALWQEQKGRDKKASENFKVHVAQRLKEGWRHKDPEMETM